MLPIASSGIPTFLVLLIASMGDAQEVQKFVVPKNCSAQVSSKFSALENPQLAMDGNTNGTHRAGWQCFHTLSREVQPWWMVDMQRGFLVYGVTVWNRVDAGVPAVAARFQKITIGLTSDQSVWSNFNSALFDVCSYYAGVPNNTDNPINLNCSRPTAGRYLAVNKNATGQPDNFFHFCEIDIYAINNRDQPPYLALNLQPSFSPSSASQLFNTSVITRSETKCVFECSKYAGCVFVLYNAASFQCWMFRSYNIPDSFAEVFNSPASTFMLALGAN